MPTYGTTVINLIPQMRHASLSKFRLVMDDFSDKHIEIEISGMVAESLYRALAGINWERD